MSDKDHISYLPTTPATQMIFETSKLWCTGHARLPWWLHRFGHRLHILRVDTRPGWEKK